MKIKELILKSQNFLQQIKFYSEVFNVPILSKSDFKTSFKIGGSILTFIKSENFTPYHFAINTSSFCEKEMLEFVKSRKHILKYEDQEIVHFPNWNANSVYFYDEDKNIVEFISRNNLHYIKAKEFGPDSLFEISEIGLATTDVKNVFNILHKNLNLEVYDGDENFERFSAIGDEHGLFICINKELKKWIPNNDEAHASEFLATIEQDGKEYKFEFKNEMIGFQN